MNRSRTISSILSTLVMLFFAVTPASADSKSDPWALRDHYKFSGDEVSFQVDPKRAEWRVVMDPADATVNPVYTEIELGDGTILRLSKSNWITDGRDTFTDGFGSAIRFRSEFKPSDGLHVEYHLNRYDSKAFMTIVLVLRNTQTKPISLRAIRMGVVEPGSLARIADAQLQLNRSTRRGIHVSLQDDGQVNLVSIRIDGASNHFGLGLLQSGFMRSSINLNRDHSSLDGNIESVFDPPIDIQPGGTAQSDPLWFLLSIPDTESLRNAHVYTESFVLETPEEMTYPTAWMTTPFGTTSIDFLKIASEWKVRSIKHMLVPGGWQGKQVRVPISMNALSKSLRYNGLIPGLTVDPLLAERSLPNVTVRAADGTHWINISSLDARKEGVQKLRQFVIWKYNFFVVSPTEMPDDVLRKLNVTRAVADKVALELMQTAAGKKPVMPSSGLTLGNDPAAWRRAAEATALNASYNIPTGSVTLDISGVNELSLETNNAIKDFVGPIEIIGIPGKKVRQQLLESRPLYATP